MSGIYSGLQARINSNNDLADYVSCAAHSINLAGCFAAEKVEHPKKSLCLGRWQGVKRAWLCAHQAPTLQS
ncbi:hypothetical protein J6590_002038 [Homalodisca vitripennis]|nr:hypothetical protein J6590_002038 [Homalodisca vitripennis]